jgi:hypothetical protein
MSLSKIQKELKVPKKHHNKFGNYHYRKLEDICEAVKPLLNEYNWHLKIEDEPVLVGERVYLKATAYVKKNKEIIEQCTAYAREPDVKKGMDESQITGAASSYARKYACNGLFGLDDTEDSDSEAVAEKPLTKAQENHAAKMRNAKTLAECAAIWEKLTEKNRDALRDVADEVREKLKDDNANSGTEQK